MLCSASLAKSFAAGLLPALMLPGLAMAQPANPDRDDLSETQTSYTGAQLLAGDQGVTIGAIEPGIYDDDEGRDRYLFWEGNSLFTGVIDDETGNRMDMVAEFYWFESSIERNSDFYVVVLKASSTPMPDTNWHVATDESWVDDYVLWRDIGPVQKIEASVDRSGEHGAIRWDWSAPFQNYRWEPSRVIEVEQAYAAGVNVEGSAMKSVTEGVKIQAKGFMNASHKVRSRYTITLWRWEMRVLAGATDMSWNLTALDPEHARDPAYHEYFLVIQAERGQPVHLDQIQYATTLREHIFLLPDRFQSLSARLTDIELFPPPAPVECEAGFEASNGECTSVCRDSEVWSDDGCVLDCGPGMAFGRGECRPDCGDGLRADGDKCVPDCHEGYRADGDRCVAECELGERIVDGECRLLCDRGFYEENGRCVRAVADVLCGEGTHLDGDQCVADLANGGTGDAQCGVHTDCPIGSHCDQGRCISRCVTDNDCGPGYLCNERAMCLVEPTDDMLGGARAEVVPMEEGGCSTVPGTASQLGAWARALLGGRR